jgi:hypothetical protein
MLTLFVTPVFYTYMETLSEKLGRRRVAAAAPASTA